MGSFRENYTAFLAWFKLRLLPFIFWHGNHSTDQNIEDPTPPSQVNISVDPVQSSTTITTKETVFANPIAEAYRILDLGKTFIGWMFPASGAFLAFARPSSTEKTVFYIAVSFSFTLIWHGLVRRHVSPRYANKAEQFGTALGAFAILFFFSSRLDGWCAWIPLACFLVFLFDLVCGLV